MNRIIKNEEDVLELMEIVSRAGRVLLSNGSEVFRVEDTMERICNSCDGLDSVDVFSMTTSIFLGIKFQGKAYTEIIREKSPAIRLSKIELVNNFSREFCSSNMSFAEAKLEIEKIEKAPLTPLYLRSLGSGITSAFFSVMFGGSFMDFSAALIIGFLVYWVLNIPNDYNIPAFLIDILSGFFSAGLGAIFITFGLGDSLDMIIIGTIMPYVPGVAITNAIRDLLSGDSVSGLMSVAKAIFTALGIALGVGMVLSVYFGG